MPFSPSCFSTHYTLSAHPSTRHRHHLIRCSRAFLPQVYSHEYDLILRPDVNTRSHTQWFFFSVANTRKGVRYKFNVINLLKSDSMYSYGMQPIIHSDKLLAQKVRLPGSQRGLSTPCAAVLRNQRCLSIVTSRFIGAAVYGCADGSSQPLHGALMASIGYPFIARLALQSCLRVLNRVVLRRLRSQGIGWHRAGTNIAYYANHVTERRRHPYYTLTFTIEFTHDFDLVHMAHFYPFTYTDVQHHLACIEADPQRAPFVKRETLCTTLAGAFNRCSCDP